MPVLKSLMVSWGGSTFRSDISINTMNGIEPITILRAAERFRMNKLFATARWSVVTKQVILGVIAAVAIGFAYGSTQRKVSLQEPSVLPYQRLLCLGKSAHFGRIRILAQGVVKVLSSGALMALFLGFEKVEIAWFLLGIAAGQRAYVWC